MSEPTFTEADRERVELFIDTPVTAPRGSVRRLLASHDSLQAERDSWFNAYNGASHNVSVAEAKRDSLQAEVERVKALVRAADRLRKKAKFTDSLAFIQPAEFNALESALAPFDGCPTCGSMDRFIVKGTCASDTHDPDDWHRLNPEGTEGESK